MDTVLTESWTRYSDLFVRHWETKMLISLFLTHNRNSKNHFKPVENDHIQLLHDVINHWLLSYSTNGQVVICDSMGGKLNRVTRKCVDALYRFCINKRYYFISSCTETNRWAFLWTFRHCVCRRSALIRLQVYSSLSTKCDHTSSIVLKIRN